MKRIIFIFSIVIMCCTNALAQAQLFVEKDKTETPVFKEHDTSGIDPFAQATRVELVTYNNRMDWWFGDGDEKPLLKDGKLNMPVDSIHSRVQLQREVAAKWQKALYVTLFCEDNLISFCYEPRHLLLFYGPDNRIFGYIEICLSCAGGRVSEGFRLIVFCPERVEYLARLVKESQKIK